MVNDQLSVEEFLSSSFWDDDIQHQLAINTPTLNEPQRSTVKRKFSRYDLTDYIDPQEDIDKNTLDIYVPFGNAQGHSVSSTDQDESESGSPYTFRHTIHESTQEVAERWTTPLAPSVAMTKTKKLEISSKQIKIISDLELIYKPRYKTDYFPQTGYIRSPRYVSDRDGNHYVSLEVMSKETGLIRIDWVTISTADGIRYSMPYKFQTNHQSPNALDCNPIYSAVEAGACRLSKHHLVLIKSKQDELKNISSLSQFPPTQSTLKTIPISHSQPVSSLAPKALIERFQLDKSQLAFTFCTLASDGHEYTPDWETTVYTSVMTEASGNTSTNKITTCPNCSHCFEILSTDTERVNHRKASKKLKL